MVHADAAIFSFQTTKGRREFAPEIVDVEGYGLHGADRAHRGGQRAAEAVAVPVRLHQRWELLWRKHVREGARELAKVLRGRLVLAS